MKPLSLTFVGMALVIAAKKSSTREGIVQEACAILDDRELDPRVINEEFNRLVWLGLFLRSGTEYVVTKLGRDSVKSCAPRVARLYTSATFA